MPLMLLSEPSHLHHAGPVGGIRPSRYLQGLRAEDKNIFFAYLGNRLSIDKNFFKISCTSLLILRSKIWKHF